MSINDFNKKIKLIWSSNIPISLSKIKDILDIKYDLFVIMIIILIGLTGFGLGKLSTLEKGRKNIEIRPAKIVKTKDGNIDLVAIDSISEIENSPKNKEILSAKALIASENSKGYLVASKSGKKYHFPWCAGASQITDKNKIWFDTYDEAIKAGYSPASNCPGLK